MRIRIPEVDEKFRDVVTPGADFRISRDSRFESHVLEDSTGKALSDDANLVVRRYACGKAMTQLRFLVHALPSQLHRMHGIPLCEKHRARWYEQQEWQLMRLIGRFFDGGEHLGRRDSRGHELGVASLVFMRRTKQHRSQEVNQLTQRHTFEKDLAQVSQPLSTSRRLEFPVGNRLRFRLNELIWKRAPLLANPGERRFPIIPVRNSLRLSHGDLQEAFGYQENRWTIARIAKDGRSVFSQDREHLEQGRIPLLAVAQDPELFREQAAYTLLVSLAGYSIPRYGPWGESLTVELDPRTLEVISIRHYAAPFSRTLAIGGSFDVTFAGTAIDEFFYS